MKVKFWGVRGVNPSSSKDTPDYGYNTPCIELKGDDDERLIIDAGSGLIGLSEALRDSDKIAKEYHILLTHTHPGHIMGFPSFHPLYDRDSKVVIMSLVNFSASLRDILFQKEVSIESDQLKAKIEYVEISEESFNINKFNISSMFLNHSIITLGYRIEYKNKVVVTMYDTESYRNLFSGSEYEEEEKEEYLQAKQYVEDMNNRMVSFARGADLLIHDAEYKKEEYDSHIGFGHSTIDYAVEMGLKSSVKRLALFHHHYNRTDKELEDIQLYAKDLARQTNSNIDLFCSKEGQSISI